MVDRSAIRPVNRPGTSSAFLIALCTLGLLVSRGLMADPVAYVSESEFLAALQTLGLQAIPEDFEDDADWGDIRSTIPGSFVTAQTVLAQGMSWSANNLSSGITTGEGAARTGQWGFYSYPHGSYTDPDTGMDCTAPGDCGDGFRGHPAIGQLYAVGAWLRTNTPYAKIGLFLDNYPLGQVDLGETCDPPGSENCTPNAQLGTAYEFFGVIDSNGFQRFEFRELEGTSEDAKLIFADDFTWSGGTGNLIFEDGFEP